MNAVSIMYVNAHLADLMAESQHNRAASLVARRSLRERLVSGIASLRGIAGSNPDPVVPALKNYGYAG